MQFGVLPRTSGPLERKLLARGAAVRLVRPPPERVMLRRLRLAHRYAKKKHVFRVLLLLRFEHQQQAIRAEIEAERRAKHPNSEEIGAEIAALYGVTLAELQSPSRGKWLCKARHHAIYEVACRAPWLSLPQIGKAFHRDHTSILHAIRVHWKRSGLKESGVPLPRGMSEPP